MGKGKGGELYAVFVLSVGGWIEKEGGEGGGGVERGRHDRSANLPFYSHWAGFARGKKSWPVVEKVLEREELLLSARIMNPWTMALEIYKTVLLLILDLLLLLGLLSVVNIQPDSPHHARVRGEGRKSPFVHFLRGAEE